MIDADEVIGNKLNASERYVSKMYHIDQIAPELKEPVTSGEIIFKNV